MVSTRRKNYESITKRTRKALFDYASQEIPSLATTTTASEINGAGGRGFAFFPLSSRAKELFKRLRKTLDNVINEEDELQLILEAKEVKVFPVKPHRMVFEARHYNAQRLMVSAAKEDLFNYACEKCPEIEKSTVDPTQVTVRGGPGFSFRPLSDRARRLVGPGRRMWSWPETHDLSEILEAEEVAVTLHKKTIRPNHRTFFKVEPESDDDGDEVCKVLHVKVPHESDSDREDVKSPLRPRLRRRRSQNDDENEDEDKAVPLASKRTKFVDITSPPAISLDELYESTSAQTATSASASAPKSKITINPRTLSEIRSIPLGRNSINYTTPEGHAQALEILNRAELSTVSRHGVEELKKTVEDMKKKEMVWMKEKASLMAENKKLKDMNENSKVLFSKMMEYIKSKEGII